MFIYNITTNIDETVEQEWLSWMQGTHIPEMLATGKFLSAKMCKVMVEEEMGGVTYSVQYMVETKEALKAYYRENASLLNNKSNAKFRNKYVYFETEMQLIDKQFASNN